MSDEYCFLLLHFAHCLILSNRPSFSHLANNIHLLCVRFGLDNDTGFVFLRLLICDL